jgi:hypothetical protein
VEDYERSKENLLRQFDELLDLPSARDYLYYTLKESQFINQFPLQTLRNLKSKYREVAYGQMEVYENERPTSPAYRFDLHTEDLSKWKIAHIEPEPPQTVQIDEIIPPGLLQNINSYQTDPEQMYQLRETFDTPSGKKTFDIMFTRYVIDYVVGSIREISEEELNAPELEPTPKKEAVIHISKEYTQKAIEYRYTDLLHYMEKYPDFREHIFSELYLRWKPLLDQNLVDITSS